MSERKPSMKFTKNSDGLWHWHAYNKNGDMVARSIAGHEDREEAEQDAATTMTAIVEDALKALQLSSVSASQALMRMKPVAESLIVSAGLAVEQMRQMGYYNERGLTGKGRKLVEDMERQRLGWEQRDLELSKAMPELKQTTHIPVQYSDQPQVVAVRVK